MKSSIHYASLKLPIAPQTLEEAVEKTNRYLVRLPDLFKTSSLGFYVTLGQRNISGFIGEILKYSISSIDNNFLANPHADGRPDLLDLRSEQARKYFSENCFNKETGACIREMVAPFKHGGIEIKCTIGTVKDAKTLEIGKPRCEVITGLTFWAHHAHHCRLLGVYYDFSSELNGAPQIRALFFTEILAENWHKVSIGNPEKKKTSNTSLNKDGRMKLYKSLALFHDEQSYKKMFDRLKIGGVQK